MTVERASIKERHAANTDYLTGIGNRRAFEAAMRAAVRTVSESVPMTLLLFDLDEFKQVNDRLGHQAGDSLLAAFAKVVGQQLREPDLFWRLGGDEFAVLLRGCSLRDAEAVTAAIHHAIEGASSIRQVAG